MVAYCIECGGYGDMRGVGRPEQHCPRCPVDLHLIAKRLGVPIGTVHKWRYRGVLPEPDYPQLRSPIWEWETIEQWALARMKKIHQAEATGAPLP